MKMPEPIGQQGRWLDLFGEFNMTIKHHLGRVHGNSNALLRRPCECTDSVECSQCVLPDHRPDRSPERRLDRVTDHTSQLMQLQPMLQPAMERVTDCKPDHSQPDRRPDRALERQPDCSMEC